MKKRIIAAALVSALLTASLTGCGGTPTESVSSEKPGEKTEEVTPAVTPKPAESGESTPAVTPEQTESTASEASVPENSVTETVQSETTPSESEVEEVKEQLKLDITESCLINNGSWCFKAVNNGTIENYLYNFADKKLVKFDIEEGYEVGDISGYSVLLLNGSNRVLHRSYGTVMRETGKLIDAASNRVLAEDLIFMWNGRWSFFADDTLLVGKHEASFSSVTNSFGLISSTGEWIYPLSSETALSDYEDLDFSDSYCDIINLGNDYVQAGGYYYSLKTNSLAKGSGFGEWLLLEGDQGYGINRGHYDITLFKYDFNTNEMTEIAKGSYTMFDDKHKTIYLGSAVYDFNTDKLTEYPELTDMLGVPLAFNNGILFNAEMKGADGNNYFGAYNLNGELVIEPIMASIRHFDYNKIVPVGDKVIINDSLDSGVYIFDTADNTLTKVENDDVYFASFAVVDDDTVVVEKSVDRKSTFFLADIDDLTKFYSPFDA